VIEAAFVDYPQLAIRFVVPDHPWVDTADGAAVRVAMTVVDTAGRTGQLLEVTSESVGGDGEIEVTLLKNEGLVTPNLTVSFDPAAAKPLAANAGLAAVGYQLTGKGFALTEDQLRSLYPQGDYPRQIIRSLVSGRDITQSDRNLFAIDLFGLGEADARHQFPALYQWVWDRVRPERMQNNRASLRERWWIFGEARSTFRPALKGIDRVLATSLTAKHRIFIGVPADTICDSTTVMFALPDGAHSGVMSSVVHVTWATAAGGRLGVGNDPRYNKSRCFEAFPFPDFQGADKFGGPSAVAVADPDRTTYPSDCIRNLAEQLDAHRERQQAAHPGLTLTGMYNVLDKLRSGEVLTAKERTIHEQGLVSVLRQLHDELDEAVLYAYGWGDLLPLLRVAHGNEPPESLQHLSDAEHDLAEHERRLHGGPATTREEAKRAFDETVLERLVALNAERAAEEARGHVRWLRPEFQNPDLAREREPEQARFANDDDAGGTPGAEQESAAAPVIKAQPWPKDTVDQVRAVADVLAASPVPLSLDEIAARFTARGPWKRRLPKLVEMLVALGRAQEKEGGYVTG